MNVSTRFQALSVLHAAMGLIFEARVIALEVAEKKQGGIPVAVSLVMWGVRQIPLAERIEEGLCLFLDDKLTVSEDAGKDGLKMAQELKEHAQELLDEMRKLQATAQATSEVPEPEAGGRVIENVDEATELMIEDSKTYGAAALVRVAGGFQIKTAPSFKMLEALFPGPFYAWRGQ